MGNRLCSAIGAFLLAWPIDPAFSAASCAHKFSALKPKRNLSSYNEVLAAMEKGRYSTEALPQIPIRLWQWTKGRLSFFVAKRSGEILEEARDFRRLGESKPIHPMGVGLEGEARMHSTRWSGIFSGGRYPVLARASLSQDNPSLFTPAGDPQKRSTAMAIKVFATDDKNQQVKTANAVFQNDLNGLLANDNSPLFYLKSRQTNQPSIDFTKIRHSYEWFTLLGVAAGSVRNPADRMARFPFINPQIRPVHSLAEMGVESPRQVNTPTWVEIRPKLKGKPVNEDDFRLEITRTLERDGKIEYEIFASDYRDSRGQIQWESVGTLTFNRAILSEGVDKNLIFPHDTLNSPYTGRAFSLPDPSKQFDSVPDDIQ